MADEVRLVPCQQTVDGRVLPVDDDFWEAGITEEEIGLLMTSLADTWVMQPDDEPEPTAATRVWRKLRAVSTPTDAGNSDVRQCANRVCSKAHPHVFGSKGCSAEAIAMGERTEAEYEREDALADNTHCAACGGPRAQNRELDDYDTTCGGTRTLPGDPPDWDFEVCKGCIDCCPDPFHGQPASTPTKENPSTSTS